MLASRSVLRFRVSRTLRPSPTVPTSLPRTRTRRTSRVRKRTGAQPRTCRTSSWHPTRSTRTCPPSLATSLRANRCHRRRHPPSASSTSIRRWRSNNPSSS
uniref:(northern house mosquito) hypothetical protein n=1 Tax=Culex pipiens TaxID=7175 RepID=A0A8D8F124_CULPI